MSGHPLLAWIIALVIFAVIIGALAWATVNHPLGLILTLLATTVVMACIYMPICNRRRPME